jgi:hypothetical protein
MQEMMRNWKEGGENKLAQKKTKEHIVARFFLADRVWSLAVRSSLLP